MDKKIMRMAPVDIPLETLLSVLHVGSEDSRALDVGRVLREATEIAEPVGLYAPFAPELVDGEVLINGVRFGEPFVYSMLSGSHTVIPYVVTCGTEIDEWSKQFYDPFEQLVLDTFMEMILLKSRGVLQDKVKAEFYDKSKNISSLNPGSLAEWPLTGQTPLFEALGGVTEDIGVVLTDALWMFPVKSVSGIFFQSDVAYENCQLCPRVDCLKRRAEYVG